jgi:hypothetical protein
MEIPQAVVQQILWKDLPAAGGTPPINRLPRLIYTHETHRRQLDCIGLLQTVGQDWELGMTKHVYEQNSRLTVADDIDHARRIFRCEYGACGRVRRYRGPFQLVDDEDSEPIDVTESEFAKSVGTYGDGLVSTFD